MRCLPELVAGPRRWVLPMADASAAALAELLASGADGATCGRLTQLLRHDPPLLLWVVCQAEQRGDFPCRSVADVAQWFAASTVDVLQWPSQRYTACETGEGSEVWAQRVAAAIDLAESAVKSACNSDPAEQGYAEICGLLRQAEQWLGGDKPDAVWPVFRDRFAGFSRMSSEQLADSRSPKSARADAAAHNWRTELHGAADWLPQLAARMARLAALENRFAETLEREKLEAMAEFAAGAGHEINNPLTVIAGRAQLFLHEETDPERRRALALINAQAMRVYEMIADMRLFARPPQPELQQVALVELVDGLIAELSPLAAQQGISLCRDGDCTLPEIAADPTQIHVALRALCQNAMEAIGADGHIKIDLRQTSGGVEIRVADDGCGIAPEERTHLFDPFFSARQAGRGLGLGLSKCWRIVTNHGGQISVESEAAHGAVFTIALPRNR